MTKLTSELERDMVAFDFLRELQKSNDAKDLEVHRLNKNPELMAFTLKHRILNTVAFRRYRSFFMMAQFMYSLAYLVNRRQAARRKST